MLIIFPFSFSLYLMIVIITTIKVPLPITIPLAIIIITNTTPTPPTNHTRPMKKPSLRPSFRIHVRDREAACGACEQGLLAGVCGCGGEESPFLFPAQVRFRVEIGFRGVASVGGVWGRENRAIVLRGFGVGVVGGG